MSLSRYHPCIAMVMADCPEAASVVGVYMHPGCAMPCRVCTQGLPGIHDSIAGFRRPNRISIMSNSAGIDLLDSLNLPLRKHCI